MQPKTGVKLDEKSFQRLRRTIHGMSVGRKLCAEKGGYASPLPLEIGLQLTDRCSLRCRHCFQWNEAGWLRKSEAARTGRDMSLDLVARVLTQTAPAGPNLYLWGGEPLSFSEWEPLARLLEETPLWTVLCTNGIDMDKRMESILRISGQLAVLVSMDGLKEENDALRGPGTFGRVMENLQLLLRLKREGLFHGEVSVNCVIHDAVIPRLFEVTEYFEEKGINTLYLCFPWFISPRAAARMDGYFRQHFAWLRTLDRDALPSWHSYGYHIDPGWLPVLKEQIQKLNSRPWRIRIRYQPALEPEEIAPFVLGDERAAQHRRLCLSVSQRMNVLPDGRVTVCKLFPELAIGDLSREDVGTLWKKPEFRRARELIHRGLMPVCSRCVLLYLHGA